MKDMASDDFDAMIADDTWLQDSPPRLSEPVSKPFNKRSKACDIDELLKDHYKDESKRLDSEAKRIRTYVSDSEDSEDEEFNQKTRTEMQFEKLVETCERQVHADGATMEAIRWGERLFTGKRRKEPPMFLTVENTLVQALLASNRQYSHERTRSEKEEESAESLVKEILASGWFLSLRFRVDSEILSWILHTMVFTNDNCLEKAACNFLCQYLERDSVNHPWIPSYKEILKFLEAYGYARPEALDYRTLEGNVKLQEHPPHNLGSLLHFLMISMKKRCLTQCYTREDVEDIAMLISSLALDRSLISFGALIKECLENTLNSLTEDEWHLSCERIATSMIKVERHMVNYLKLTRALHSREKRMKSLQSMVAFLFFAKIANKKPIHKAWEMLSIFREIDVKRTSVDYVTLYYQMCLADIWLWSTGVLDSDEGALGSWLVFLKSCSFQISSTDWRPFATKARNQASYLLQVYQCYHQKDGYDET